MRRDSANETLLPIAVFCFEINAIDQFSVNWRFHLIYGENDNSTGHFLGAVGR